jgi:hypothetical protein
MVVEGSAIAISGWALRRVDQAIWRDESERLWRIAVGVLFVILIGSRLVLRLGSARSALRDPARRAGRFFRAHLSSAMLGALAVPLGIAYGWAAQPTLQGIAPFWIVALGVGFLSLPRAIVLEGFDQPMTPASGEYAADRNPHEEKIT